MDETRWQWWLECGHQEDQGPPTSRLGAVWCQVCERPRRPTAIVGSRLRATMVDGWRRLKPWVGK